MIHALSLAAVSAAASLAQAPDGQAPAPQPIQPLTVTGWMFLVVSVGFVVILAAWCFYKVLSAPSESTVNPPDSLGG